MDINYRQELQKARQAIEGLERTGQPSTISAYWEVCCGDVLVAEENAQEMNRVWENSSLAKELLDIATYLEGYDHMLNKLNTAVSRMIDVLYDHPSLTLQLLEFQTTNWVKRKKWSKKSASTATTSTVPTRAISTTSTPSAT